MRPARTSHTVRIYNKKTKNVICGVSSGPEGPLERLPLVSTWALGGVYLGGRKRGRGAFSYDRFSCIFKLQVSQIDMIRSIDFNQLDSISPFPSWLKTWITKLTVSILAQKCANWQEVQMQVTWALPCAANYATRFLFQSDTSSSQLSAQKKNNKNGNNPALATNLGLVEAVHCSSDKKVSPSSIPLKARTYSSDNGKCSPYVICARCNFSLVKRWLCPPQSQKGMQE